MAQVRLTAIRNLDAEEVLSSGKVLKDWVRWSHANLTYALCLSHWATDLQSTIAASHMLLARTHSNDAALQRTQKSLFLMHCRQYLVNTHAFAFMMACSSLKNPCLRLNAVPTFAKSTGCVHDKEKGRVARYSMIECIICQFVRRSILLRGSVVSIILSRDLTFDAMISLVNYNGVADFEWKFIISQILSHQRLQRAMCCTTRVSLRACLNNINGVERAHALQGFCTLARTLVQTSNNAVHSCLFDNAVLIRTWPKSKTVQTWCVETVVVYIGSLSGVSRSTTITKLPMIIWGCKDLISHRRGFYYLPRCQYSALQTVDAATSIAALSMLHVHCPKSPRIERTITITGHVVVVLTCLPLYGKMAVHTSMTCPRRYLSGYALSGYDYSDYIRYLLSGLRSQF